MVSPIITSLSGSGVTDPMGCGCGCREPVSSSSGLWDPPSKSLVYGLETGAPVVTDAMAVVGDMERQFQGHLGSGGWRWGMDGPPGSMI